MKFSPPMLIVLFMFLSFSVVMGTMIALFRPAPAPPAASSASLSDSSAQFTKALATNRPADKAGSAPDSAGGVASGSQTVAGGDTSRERGDLNLLKAEVEGHLKTQKAAEEQKIAHLARLCARLEPGQAAVALSSLDEATVHRVLSQLDKDSALKIQSVLVRIRKGNG